MATPGDQYRPAPQDDDHDEHDRLYEEALALIEPHLPMNQPQDAELLDEHRAQLQRGVEMLRRVIAINPQNWPAMWVSGMALRRLSELAPAMQMFTSACQLSGDNPDVPREAAITAMELGHYADAVMYTEQAIDNNPADAGLVANLALAHLLNQNPTEARRAAAYAVEADPADEISRQILAMIEDVVSGKRPNPRHPREF